MSAKYLTHLDLFLADFFRILVVPIIFLWYSPLALRKSGFIFWDDMTHNGQHYQHKADCFEPLGPYS